MAIDSRHELPLLAQLVVEFFMQKYAKIYSMRSESDVLSLHCNIGVAAHFVMLKYIYPYFQNTHKNLLSHKYSVILSSGASRVPNS
ncbi:hypothetical protein T05_14017 [Trichinella murrelli]|uniref:Uncharacterized protein n=1 Tax=Trichinella murrelli TaxID=144512 RepID=A0A0V0TI08_9BILA|nr:hypothetical protein T05_14017 [Trichinella murrelli]